MKKNILLLFLAAGLIAFNSGCTSKESTGDEQPVENADVEKIETIDGGEPAATAAAPDAGAPAAAPTDAAATPESKADDAALEASLNDPTPAPTTDAAAATPAATPPADTNTPTIDDKAVAATEAPPVSDAQLAPDPALALGADAATGAPSGISEAPAPVDTMAGSEPKVKPSAVGKSVSAPLKKISAITPYQAKSGGWVNTVYIARPKEKLLDISMKIFGSDKVKDLKSIAENSYLKSRAPKAGDKIYYVSPNRPDDSTRTIAYYEDMGMVPETYVAKKGDSLRKISKELLGYDNAWKEVWASNPIESKTTLKDGETIRYWKMASAPDVAAMASPPPTPPPTGASVTDASGAPTATATTAPPTGSLPPPPADAGANLPAPPPTGTDTAAAPPPPADTTAAAPPPPPPPADTAAAAPPPPPPPADEAAPPPADGAVADGGKKGKGKEKLDAAAAEEGEGLNQDALMSMGALGVLVALLAFVIIRKKKQKSQMSNLEMNA